MTTRAIRDERWFDALFRSHHGAVLGYARRRVDDPDDVVSEVFAAAWRNRAKVPDAPLPWLLRTAGNVVLHDQRSRGRRLRLAARTASSSSATSSPDHADSVADALDASSVVSSALQRLRPADQELLRLLAWDDLAHDDLAAVLNCSVATVRVRLHRARRRFEDELERSRPDESSEPRRQETRP